MSVFASLDFAALDGVADGFPFGCATVLRLGRGSAARTEETTKNRPKRAADGFIVAGVVRMWRQRTAWRPVKYG